MTTIRKALVVSMVVALSLAFCARNAQAMDTKDAIKLLAVTALIYTVIADNNAGPAVYDCGPNNHYGRSGDNDCRPVDHRDRPGDNGYRQDNHRGRPGTFNRGPANRGGEPGNNRGRERH